MKQCRLTRRRAGQRRRGRNIPSAVKATSVGPNERVNEVVDIATRGGGRADGLTGGRA